MRPRLNKNAEVNCSSCQRTSGPPKLTIQFDLPGKGFFTGGSRDSRVCCQTALCFLCFLLFKNPTSAIPNPQSKRWGPIGLLAECFVITNSKSCQSTRWSASTRAPFFEPDRAHRAVAHLGQRVGQLRSTTRRPVRHFSPRPANTSHYMDLQKDFSNYFWPPWRSLTRRRRAAEETPAL